MFYYAVCILNAIEVQAKIRQITDKEHVQISDKAITTLIDVQKDFRQILNTLQCLHYIRIGDIGNMPMLVSDTTSDAVSTAIGTGIGTDIGTGTGIVTNIDTSTDINTTTTIGINTHID